MFSTPVRGTSPIIIMKKLKHKKQNEHLELFADDIQKIVESFAREGYEVSPEDACSAWEEYSDAYCAGWLCMGKRGLTPAIIKELMKYFEEEN